MDLQKHLIFSDSTIKEALFKLNILGPDAILFVVDTDQKLIGSLTDGDIRRGILDDLTLKENLTNFINKSPKILHKKEYNIQNVIEYRNDGYRIVPLVDNDGIVCDILNFRLCKSFLPLEVVIMAGGRGERLKPLTNETPKPLLKVGGKSIIEHNIDHLINYGVKIIHVSIGYLGSQIINYLKDGREKGIAIKYIDENSPLGTIGAAAQANLSEHNDILIINSDILTNIDYEDFYLDFIDKKAKFSVLSVPYKVNVPYAVLETIDENVVSFKEKPTYTYYSNGGIYLMKKECLDMIPRNSFFNSTDLMELLISKGEKILSYPLRDYWLDIGKHEDFERAQQDILHIKF
jgi:dTDP-glucose pyrophosphorylase